MSSPWSWTCPRAAAGSAWSSWSVRMLHTPVVLDDGRTIDVAASVGAAAPDVLGIRDLAALQRAAGAALYDGKHSVENRPQHWSWRGWVLLHAGQQTD
ncbi:hypothetical protein [Streptomyces luridiscabiei]|uniref:hypothetical protein n=1 Tax=Streptomyces luridiscabiei TaxID=164114 RepID=UPI000AC3885B|nr:hypothetical protein [Streptomyces luridiscabiei]